MPRKEFTERPDPAANDTSSDLSDPVELLDGALASAWQRICDTVDVTAEMPALPDLFAAAPLDSAGESATVVVANMLGEVMEWVCRFSPWYTKPASAYGLDRICAEVAGTVEWRLSRAGMKQWREPVAILEEAFHGQGGLLRMLLLVDELMEREEDDESPCTTATCRCMPPRVILVKRVILDEAEIRCDQCQQLFRAAPSA